MMSKETEISLRKQKIWNLYKQGFTQQQIASKLDMSLKTISRDFKELKNESIEWMETLPNGEIQLQHKKNFEIIDKVLQELWNLYDNTKDENKKITILNIIAQKCKIHNDMMSINSLWEVRGRIHAANSVPLMPNFFTDTLHR